MSLPPREKEELQDAAVHVAYERFALDLGLKAFLHTNRSLDLEATLIHARNLTEFFWPGRSPHPDGVYAAHYLPTWDTQSLPQRPNERYRAMSAQLVHISVQRSPSGNPRDFAGEIGSIAADLGKVWDGWRQALDGTEWDASLEAAGDRWRNEALDGKGSTEPTPGEC